MRALLKLIKLECGFLKTSIILIGAILILFSGAFLSVVSVCIDVPSGMYDRLNSNAQYLMFTSNDVPLGVVGRASDVTVGCIEGLTYNATITSDGGSYQFGDPAPYISQNTPYGNAAQGMIIAEGSDQSAYGEYLVSGELPRKAGEMLMGKNLSDRLKVGVGDKVSVGENEFTVTGIYDRSTFAVPVGQVKRGSFYFLAVMSDDTVIDKAYLSFGDGRDLKARSEEIREMGYNADVTNGVQLFLDNIDTAVAFFTAVAIVLGIMVVFILYALISTFYRQRRSQTCRLRMLGASTARISAIYCVIAGVLVLIAVVAGSVLSIWFNKYFMNLCEQLFSSAFVSHFHIYVPSILLVVMMAFVLIMFAVYQGRIERSSLAQEVKHE